MDELLNQTEDVLPDDSSGNKHYITVDTSGHITDGWSDGPHQGRETEGAILLREDGGYQFRLWPDGEENPPLYTDDGIPLYRWDGERVVERTAEEIEADRAAIPEPPPSETEQLKAKVAALEAEKAERAELEAMAAAIERGLSV